MTKTNKELIARQREINALLASCKEEERETLVKEYESNKREIETNNQEASDNANQREEKQSLVKQLREAIKENKRTITVQGYTTDAGSVAGVHNHVVDEEYQGILEPLYAKSVLAELGVRWYPGMPQGDVKIPIMGKNTVGWEGEIGAASQTGNTFSSLTMKPKRLCAYVDISKQLIMQDTIGAEAAIKRDLANALKDKLEATIFGDVQGSTNQPAGIFYNVNLGSAVTTFAGLCALESDVEDANFFGNMKYLLSPKAKADLRAMAKSSKTTELVLQGGSVDGVPAIVTGNVNPAIAAVGTQGQDGYVAAHGAAGSFVYGDFSNLAVASWGDVEIGIYDDSNTSVNGTIRLVVNAYFDAQILRAGAFAYGKTR